MRETSHELILSVIREGILLVVVGCILWGLDRKWHLVRRFFSEGRPPIDLAVVRIVIFSAILLYSCGDNSRAIVARYAALDRSLWEPPLGWKHLVPLMPMSGWLVDLAFYALYAACIAAIFGLLYRWSSIIAVACAFYTMTIPQLFGKVNHDHHLILLALILALSPSADALSIDAWLRKRRACGELRSDTPLSRSYGFPIAVMSMIVSCAYLFPGTWKIARGGARWFSGENLKELVVQKLQEFSHTTPIQAFFLDHRLLLVMGAWFAIFFEVGFIFFVLSKWTRPLAVLCGLSFHTMTLLFMGINFATLEACYVVLVPWGALLGFLSTKVGRNPVAFVPISGEPSRLLLGVSTLTLAGMVLLGVTHQTGAWPIVCYPTFDASPPTISRELVVDARGMDGRSYSGNLTFDRQLGTLYGPERWRVIASPDPPETTAGFPEARAKALIRLWSDTHGVGSLQSATLLVDTYDLNGPTKVRTGEQPMITISLGSSR